MKQNKGTTIASGVAAGIINGLFGSGGGMVAVPLLKSLHLQDRQAHATAISMTLPLSLVSGWLYLRSGAFTLQEAYPYLLPGLLGALIGSFALKRIPIRLLQRLFAALVLYAGIRLLL